MKKILNILLIYFGPCLLIVMLFYSRDNIKNQTFKVSGVNIKTDQNQFVSRSLIDTLLYDYIVDDDGEALTLSQISFEKIERVLLSHPSVSSANIYSDINGNVTIDVTPRTPIARVYNGGDVYYIDLSGEKMELSSDYTSRSLIVKGDLNSLSQLDIFRVCDHIYNDNFLRRQITCIDVLDSELSMFARTGELIEFGTVSGISDKFRKLKLYYGNVDGSFSILDVRYNNQIICKNS